MSTIVEAANWMGLKWRTASLPSTEMLKCDFVSGASCAKSRSALAYRATQAGIKTRVTTRALP